MIGTAAIERSGQPFLIEDPGKTWIVDQGRVDVFLAATEGGESVGARTHVLRVEAGQAIFGVEPGAAGSGIGCFASLAAGARVRCLVEDGVDAIESNDRAVLLDAWLLGLSRAAGASPVPSTFERLRPGHSVILKPAQNGCPRDGTIVWVEAGPLGSTLSMPGAGQAPGSLRFPVSPHLWITATAESDVNVLETRDVLPGPLTWKAVHAFQRACFVCLLERVQAQIEKENTRLGRKQRGEALGMDRAVRRLAGVLLGRKMVAEPADTGEDTYLLACRAMEAPLGIHFLPHPDSKKGIFLKDPVQAIARASGVRVRTVLLRGAWWTKDVSALLARREKDKRPVALLPASGSSYDLYDPMDGTTVRVDEKIALSLEPFAWSFSRPFPIERLGAHQLLAFGLRNQYADLAAIFGMGLGAALLALAVPAATAYIFDNLIPGAKQVQLMQIGALLAVAAISTGLFQTAKGFAILRLETRLDSVLQSAVWDRLLALPVPFFRNYSAGDLAQRGLGIMAMRQMLTGSVFSSILSGIFAATSFAVLFYYSWALALIAAGLLAFAVLFVMTAGWIQIREQRQMASVQGRIAGLVLQLIQGVNKIRVAAAEKRAFGRWASEYAEQKRITLRARGVLNVVSVFTAVFPVVCLFVIFYEVATGSVEALSTGSFLAFLVAFTQFLTGGLELSNCLVSVLGMVPVYERAAPILRTLPEIHQAGSYPGDLTGHVELRNVSFRYRPDSPLVLKKLSLVAEPGQFVAIVGPSGSGKSTLFRLLLGFEFPESGAIYYDRRDLMNLDVSAVRQQIGVVLQNVRIRAGSLYTNIVGSAPLTLDDAWEAARMAGFEDDIRAMPMGMQTALSEGGAGLSGGQRQRLLIARSFACKPRIVFFDEATSALDNQTQSIVSASLERLHATRLVIAHRLSTIRKADVIYVIVNGEVQQRGSYDELMAVEGPFLRLARRQIA